MFRTDLLSIIRSLNTLYTQQYVIVMLVLLIMLMEHPDLATGSQQNQYNKYLLLWIQY